MGEQPDVLSVPEVADTLSDDGSPLGAQVDDQEAQRNKKRLKAQRLKLKNMIGFSGEEDSSDAGGGGPSTGGGPLDVSKLPSVYHRTRMCYNFLKGRCNKGRECNFAHTQDELRHPGEARHEVQSNLQLKLQSEKGGGMRRGDFSGDDMYYKTQLCPYLLQNKCNYGRNCYFAHGTEELRPAPGRMMPMMNPMMPMGMNPMMMNQMNPMSNPMSMMGGNSPMFSAWMSMMGDQRQKEERRLRKERKRAAASPGRSGKGKEKKRKRQDSLEDAALSPPDWRHLLEQLYRKHCPAKLIDIDTLLEKYQGAEAEMYERACQKYGVTPKKARVAEKSSKRRARGDGGESSGARPVDESLWNRFQGLLGGLKHRPSDRSGSESRESRRPSESSRPSSHRSERGSRQGSPPPH